jgi:hypothetical protein
MNYQLIISESFFVYDRKMNKIYEELNSLRESYSYTEYNRLLEGFWDRVKSIAGQTGKAVGDIKNAATNSVNVISKLGKDVYDKGVELGKKALEVGKELYNKISSAISTAIQTIKSAPGQLWDAVVSLSTTVGSEIAEVYKKAKEKGGEWLESAKQTAIDIYKKMASGLADAYKSLSNWATQNVDKFKEMLKQKSVELKEASDVAKQSTFDGVKQIGEFISSMYTKIKDGTIEVAKFSGKLLLSLLVLPFYATYLVTKKTYEVGEEFVDAMKAGINTLKTNLGESWDAAVAGYQSTQEPIAKESIIIKSFGKFIK